MLGPTLAGGLAPRDVVALGWMVMEAVFEMFETTGGEERIRVFAHKNLNLCVQIFPE